MDENMAEYLIRQHQEDVRRQAAREHLAAQARQPGQLRRKVGDALIRLGTRLKTEADLTAELVARSAYSNTEEWVA